jgi:hypothetical protein
MKYEGLDSISCGMWCAQIVSICFRCARREGIIRNKYLIRSGHYKSRVRPWLKNVPKGTYKSLLCEKISSFFTATHGDGVRAIPLLDRVVGILIYISIMTCKLLTSEAVFTSLVK